MLPDIGIKLLKAGLSSFFVLYSGSQPKVMDPPPAGPPIAPAASAVHRTLDLGGGALAYIASAGLMPIAAPDGHNLGDMSYLAYLRDPPRAPARGSRKPEPLRPLLFVWNGGPGSVSDPVNFGAFGPLRLDIAAGRLTPNAASLLDVGDLVFIDQMNTGFGRAADGLDEEILTEPANAATFVTFIETWLKTHSEEKRPVILVGESYGVRRAVLIAPKLAADGVALRGLVLISGYPSVLADPEATDRAMTTAQLITLSWSLKVGEAGRKPDLAAAYAESRRWAREASAFRRSTRDDLDLGIKLKNQLLELTGAPVAARADSVLGLASEVFTNGDPVEKFYYQLVADSERGKSMKGFCCQLDLYDGRYRAAASEQAWQSPAVVDDIRNGLHFDPPRPYQGQESARAPTGYRFVDRTRFDWKATADTSLTRLLEQAPDLKVEIASGIFDQIFPCVQTDLLVERDLAAYGDRVDFKCYAGGHMMYLEPAVGAELSADVRAFVLGVGK